MDGKMVPIQYFTSSSFDDEIRRRRRKYVSESSESDEDEEDVEKIFFFDWKTIDSPFDILPMEMKTIIFQYFDPEDITRFGKCSKSCQKLFKAFRPKIKSVKYRGNGISRLASFRNCMIEVEFHNYPERRYKIEVESLKSVNWAEIERSFARKMSRRDEMIESARRYLETMGTTKLSNPRGARSNVLLTKIAKVPLSTGPILQKLSNRRKPKCRRTIAIEILKNIIEHNKLSIESISIEASINESRNMRNIDIYSENLKKLKLNGYFTKHPQLNKFLSIEDLEMENLKLGSEHLPLIKSNKLVMHRTVMDKELYEEFFEEMERWKDCWEFERIRDDWR
ncbi:unnamed protein product [Caenorhabditis angaria]|uniref:F-box domain-containing protein n=1 Tax=Caenorhabditis angaria TaxID=860376 RepID=A0A9P1I8R5_9PELO|nr:unnamed protein product [Caenorhabditis angaria]